MTGRDCKDCKHCQSVRGFMCICKYKGIEIGQDLEHYIYTAYNRNHAVKCALYEEREVKEVRTEPCEDAISRSELLKAIYTWDKFGCDADTKLVPYQDHYIPYIHYDDVVKCIKGMPSVQPEPKIGHCKECKYFEYDSVAKVDGMPLIVAHEICSKWGDGCKTKEDGYCFLFEAKKSEDKECQTK